MNDKKKEGSFTEKIKEGVSVQELESFARKYTTEVFLIIAILIATFSSIFDFFTGSGWSVFFGGIGAIFSIAFPKYANILLKKTHKILFKQEKTTQIIVGIIRIVVALFLPFIVFAMIGILAGTAFHNLIKEHQKEKPDIKKEEEEHL